MEFLLRILSICAPMLSSHDVFIFVTLYNVVLLTYGLSDLAVYDYWLLLFKELLLMRPL